MTGRRIVSIWLPGFPMDRWLRQARRTGNAWPDEEPLALSVEGRHGPVVHAANHAGQVAGVQVGARVVDMQALNPALRVAPTDPEDDRAALARLALWAQRWCPWTVAEADGLMLDITGSGHLWGGESAMLAEIEGRLATAGFAARPVVAPTRGAAWALARFGPRRAICEDLSDLHPLPTAALRLSAETVLLLDRLGLKRVGDLAGMPRLPLARRFIRAVPEDNPLLRLDQAMGRMSEPLNPAGAPPDFRAELRLAEPILDPAPCSAVPPPHLM